MSHARGCGVNRCLRLLALASACGGASRPTGLADAAPSGPATTGPGAGAAGIGGIALDARGSGGSPDAGSRSAFDASVAPGDAATGPDVVTAAGDGPAAGATAATFAVVELSFSGPPMGPSDAPARDVELWVRFRHESGTEHQVWGFWDGDGRGGVRGGVYQVRFAPTLPGTWLLAEVFSNRPELRGQHEGERLVATRGPQHGFWLVDGESAGRRWFKRTDGTHQYIFGNTHYTFLSQVADGRLPPADIAADVRANATYFKKLRFAVQGDRYPNPVSKPFFTDAGAGTDDGDYSHRPNPEWFSHRVDVAVRAAYDVDLIADLILNGPDTDGASRRALRAAHNGGDAEPYLRYIAARYGAFPNVWFCLSNEYDLYGTRYTPAQIAGLGARLQRYLPYRNPVSVHGAAHVWDPALGGGWNTHATMQNKIATLDAAADLVAQNYRAAGGDRPSIDDELGYQGELPESAIIAGHVGAFLGGGYGTTAMKPGEKVGQYFWGHFDAAQHSASAHLRFVREVIDRDIAFWKLAPAPASALLTNAPPGARLLASSDGVYVLGTAAAATLTARLQGSYRVVQYDAAALRSTVLSEAATGLYTFRVPAGAAALTYFAPR